VWFGTIGAEKGPELEPPTVVACTVAGFVSMLLG
jgi:hypothetical protein